MKIRKFRSRTLVQHAARALVETLEHRRLLAAGDIDPSFGDDGVIFNEQTLAVHAVLPDGRFYTGGGLDGAGGIIRRHLPNGQLDATWDGSGLRQTNTQFSALALTPDQKVVIAGRDLNGNLVIEKYLATGRLDSSFNGSGIKKFDFADANLNTASQAGLHDVLVRGDGKIVAAGFTARPGSDGVVPVVVRVNPDGSFDGSMRGGAVFLNQFDIATDVELQSDGRMIVGGFSGASDASTIVRVNKDGSIDSSFGTGGKIDIAAGGDTRLQDIEIISGDRIVFTAEIVDDGGDSDGLLGQLGRNGAIDASFGNGGFVRRHDVRFGDVDIDQNGKLVLGGIFENETDGVAKTALSRLNQDGTFDASFAGDGVAVFEYGFSTSGGQIAIQGNAILQSGTRVTVLPGHGLPSSQSFLHRVQGLGEVEPPPQNQEPWIGRPWTINENIEAEGFDFGGQGIAYHDQEPQNLGGAYRPNEGVDIHANNDGGRGFNVGWVNNGEYLEYTINVPQAGNYVFDARIATPKNGARMLFSLDSDPQIDISVPNTGSFFNWRTINTNLVNLPAGTHVLRVTFNGPANIGGLTNLNWLRIRPADDGGGGGEGQAGDLDRSFAGDGLLQVELGMRTVFDVITDRNGRIVIVGHGTEGSPTSPPDPIVARLLPDGAIDRSFGANGRTVLDVHPEDASHGMDIELAPDGKIAVLTHGFGGAFVARLNPDGTLDGSFKTPASSEWTDLDRALAGIDLGGDLEIQSDGKLVIGGSDLSPTIRIVRLQTNGDLDRSFGRSGVMEIQMQPRTSSSRGSQDRLLGIELTPDNRIVAGGIARLTDGASAFSVARLNSNGLFDTTFFGGRAYAVDRSADFDPHKIFGGFELQSDGRAVIVAASADDPNLKLFRFTDRARPDPTYGSNGLVSTGLELQPYDMAMQRDGKLVIAGQIGNGAGQLDFALLRLGANGQVDSSFRQDSSTQNWPSNQLFRTAHIQADGNILAGGITQENGAFSGTLARFLGSGQQQPPSTGQQTPFRGTPFNINDVIQAEDFDNGGEGIAYHDQEAANLGGVNYRPGLGVDILNTTDDGGGRKVGYWQSNDWLEYTIHVPTTGQYAIQSRIATPKNGGLLTYALNGDILTGTRLAEVQIPNTGNFNRFQTVSSRAVTLPAGTHVLHVHPYSGDPNGVADVNWFRIVPAGN